MANFNFELVSPEKLLLSAEAASVVLPASEGEMTVMANHAPTMTTVKPGIVSVAKDDGSTDKYVVFGGFADIVPDNCTLLAEAAVAVSDLSDDELNNRIAEANTQLEVASSENEKTRLSSFVSQLEDLKAAL